MMKHTEDYRIPVGGVGYNSANEFCSVPFSGEVIEIFDNQRWKCQFCDG